MPAVVALLTLLFLHSPVVPHLSDQPTSFDGERALADAQTLAQQFPGRTPGSDADARSAIWLVERLKQLGLQPHIGTFTGVVDGRSVALQNVWADLTGQDTRGHRRAGQPRLAAARQPGRRRQRLGRGHGARAGPRLHADHARAPAALPLDRRRRLRQPRGRARSWPGTPISPIIAALALRRVGAADLTRVSLDGWSASPRVAPPWTWILTSSSQRTVGGLAAPLPHALVQMLHLAAPVGSGSQGPFVEAGVPAISVDSRRSPAAAATRHRVDHLGGDAGPGRARQPGAAREHRRLDLAPVAERHHGLLLPLPHPVGKAGRAHAARPGASARGRDDRPVRAGAAAQGVTGTGLDALRLPLRALAGAAPRHRLRGELRRPAPGRARDGHLARIAGRPAPAAPARGRPSRARRDRLPLRPRGGPPLPAARRRPARGHRPGRPSGAPRRRSGHVPREPLLAPAVPSRGRLLAAGPPGGWQRSLLPVCLGFAAFAAVLVVSAAQLHLGLSSWWYFFVLLENGTVPVPVAVATMALLAAALMLARALRRSSAAAAPPPRSRRRPTSPSTASRTASRPSRSRCSRRTGAARADEGRAALSNDKGGRGGLKAAPPASRWGGQDQ